MLSASPENIPRNSPPFCQWAGSFSPRVGTYWCIEIPHCRIGKGGREPLLTLPSVKAWVHLFSLLLKLWGARSGGEGQAIGIGSRECSQIVGFIDLQKDEVGVCRIGD